jgi:lipopolysaccharide export system ATP-binding protein
MTTVYRPESGTAEAKGPRLVTDNPGLIANNLGKRFKKRPVVRDVTLSVQRGEVVGLLGPNGAGKTTCFYMITGLIAPDTGVIRLDGTDITDLPMYRRARLGVGYLPQEPSIFRGLSVEQNIRAVLEVVEPDRGRRHPRAGAASEGSRDRRADHRSQRA